MADNESGKTKLEKILKQGPASRFVLALREADGPMLLTEVADLIGVSVASIRTQSYLNRLFELDVIETIPDEADGRRKRYKLKPLSVADGRSPSEKLRDKRSRTRRTDLP